MSRGEGGSEVALRAGTWPLVGRDEEVGAVARLLGRPDGSGVVIAGGLGTGKTRLAAEALAIAERDGRPTERVVATRAAASIPLGAFAALLPPVEGRAATAELLQLGIEELSWRPDGDRLVLLVDDAHLLDEASATLLHQVVLTGRVFAVTTLRSGEPAPDAVAAIWKDRLAERLELQDLSQEETARLLQEALGGEIDPATSYRLWEMAAGNPLFLRELVLGAVRDGSLEETSGVWVLRDPLVAPPSLREIVGRRVADLSDDAREALSTIAFAESVGVEDVAALHGADALAMLEARGLAQVVRSDYRSTAELAHPVYGEVLRGELSAAATGRVAAALAARLRAVGSRRRDDVLRLVTYELDAGVPPEPDRLRQAAVHAYQAGDFATAERLARLGPPDDHEARLLLAQVFDESGRPYEADEVIAELPVEDLAPSVRARAALLGSDVSFFGLGREEQALRVLEGAEQALVGRHEVGELTANRGWLQLHAGRPEEALATVADLDRSDDPLVRVAGAIVASHALAIVGRTAEALESAEHAMHPTEGDRRLAAARHSDFPALARGYALLHAGSLDDAEAVALRGLEGVLTRRPTFLRAHWLTLLGWARHARGELASAAGCFQQAAALQRHLGQVGLLRWNLAGLALAAAQAGAPEQADAALGEHDQLGDRPERVFAPEAARARAWALAARRQVGEALRELATAADMARTFGAVAFEAACLHDVARLGDAGSAKARLSGLDDDSPLTAARIRHVSALAAGNPDELAAAADGFELLGALLLAAEAHADAARARRGSGEARAAQRHRLRSADLAARCEGARTPALALDDEVSPLTERELQIVTMAAGGLTSREIAEQLVVSVRTVDNLLHRAYVKLGVGSRADAAIALGLVSGGRHTDELDGGR